MDWKTDYAAKRTTAAAAMGRVKSGDRVVFAHACGEPVALVDALVDRAPELSRVEIDHMVTMGQAKYCRPEYADAFYHKSLFVGATSREAVKDGRGDYIPVFFSEIPKLFCEGYLTPDVVLAQVSPPDKHGFCSFGISVDYTKPAAQVAKTVIAQVNPCMPRTHGRLVHGRRGHRPVVVERAQECSRCSRRRIDRGDAAIGKHIAGLVEDGSSLQFGIGRIPRRGPAVPAREEGPRHPHRDAHRQHHRPLRDGRDHRLAQAARPRPDRRRASHGDAAALRLRRRQPGVNVPADQYVNDPVRDHEAAQMVVAINTALEVDLTGQVCADSLGARVHSGIGGQVDFDRGRGAQPDGKPSSRCRPPPRRAP